MGINAPSVYLGNTNTRNKTMQKQETIAATMRLFMASGPSAKDFPTYKALNDAVGAVHGLAEGKCQALAGEKAWKWTADQTTGKWRIATDVEIESRRAKAAGKTHGTRVGKVLGDADRAALDAQVAALETVDNPALAGLLAGLKAQQVADDLARKGSLKDRLAAAVDRIGVEKVVDFLEKVIADYDAKTGDAKTGDAGDVTDAGDAGDAGDVTETV